MKKKTYEAHRTCENCYMVNVLVTEYGKRINDLSTVCANCGCTLREEDPF